MVQQMASSCTVERCQEEQLVLQRLIDSHYFPLRSVACRFEDGVLTLQGRVPSFYLKQVAQEACVDLAAVRQVVNLIEVSV